MQIFCASRRLTTPSVLVAAVAVSVGFGVVAAPPTPHPLATELTAAARHATLTVSGGATRAAAAFQDGLHAAGPTVAGLLAASPTLLSSTSVEQLATLAAAPAAVAPLIAPVAAITATGDGGPAARIAEAAPAALAAVPATNPAADLNTVVAAVQALVDEFARSLQTTPQAIGEALGLLQRGDVNGAFTRLEGLLIIPLITYAFSPYPQQAADAIARYLPGPLANAVTAAPNIIVFQAARGIDVYTSARRSVVDAVQGVIASLGTFNPLAIAGAVAAGLGNVAQTAIANTFGANGVFSIAYDLVTGLLKAAFPNTATTPPAETTRTLAAASTKTSSTTSVAPAPDAPEATPTAPLTSTGTSSDSEQPTTAPESSTTTPAPETAATLAPATPPTSVSVSVSVSVSATVDDTSPTRPETPTTDRTDPAPTAATSPTTGIDVTSGNKVEPKPTTGTPASKPPTGTTTQTSATAGSTAARPASPDTDATRSGADNPTSNGDTANSE